MEVEDFMNSIKNTPTMSFKEIAEELDMPLSTVFRVYTTALAKIRKQLTEEELEEIREFLSDGSSVHEYTVSGMILDDEEEGSLRGFWREEHNTR